MKPKTGGRVVLDLVKPGSYAAELFVPDAEWRSSVEVSAEGVVAFAAWSGAEGAPPDWLVKYATTFLRSAWKDVAKGGTWPERVNRWRDER